MKNRKTKRRRRTVIRTKKKGGGGWGQGKVEEKMKRTTRMKRLEVE